MSSTFWRRTPRRVETRSFLCGIFPDSIRSPTRYPVPPDRRQGSRWFWEPSHYKKEIGDLIIDRMLDYHATGPSRSGRFRRQIADAGDIEPSWSKEKRWPEYVRAEPAEARFIQDVGQPRARGFGRLELWLLFWTNFERRARRCDRGDKVAAEAAIASAPRPSMKPTGNAHYARWMSPTGSRASLGCSPIAEAGSELLANLASVAGLSGTRHREIEGG